MWKCEIKFTPVFLTAPKNLTPYNPTRVVEVHDDRVFVMFRDGMTDYSIIDTSESTRKDLEPQNWCFVECLSFSDAFSGSSH